MNGALVRDIILQSENDVNRYQQLFEDIQAHTEEMEHEKLDSISNQIGFQNVIEDEVLEYRLKKIIREENPYLPELDLSQLQTSLNYNHYELQEQIRIFMQQRKEFLNLLSFSSNEVWNRAGVLSSEGHISFYDLIERFLKKSEQHLDNLKKLLSRQ